MCAPLIRRMSGYPGGIPGMNLPFRKGIENPMRFTLIYLVLGTLGFGAPFLVIRHQMLRNVDDKPKEE
ncbi:GH21644 [Drosophila grimshawi]|uniref:GH21644 n=2 Tax=Drosophila grimshawi TaxID=7222 RepID=B4J5N4_DROGR|nr:GH21644 [Drosophila grimshawi]